MVSQNNHICNKVKLVEERQLSRTLWVPNLHIAKDLFVVTLGNPQKNCRHFGICKIDKWQDDIEMNLSKQCLAEFSTEEAPASHLRGFFIKELLSKEIRSTHFNREFIVEAPYLFGSLKIENESFLEVTIMPGRYPIEEWEDRLEVYFDIL